MKKSRRLSAGLAVALIASCACNVFASAPDSVGSFPEERHRRDVANSIRVVPVGQTDLSDQARRDSLEHLMAMFYANQFRHFQDPQAPGLMFLSRDADFAMGIAGVVRMRGWFDWDGAIQANGFCPYLIPMEKDPLHKRRLGATPAGTALVFTMFGRNSFLGDYMAYIEAGFNGYNNIDFKLKKAYVTIRDWTIGYATSTFCDPSTLAPVIDGAGANGSLSKTNVLVRWLHAMPSGWNVAASLEIPKSQADVSGSDVASCDDWIPDFAAFLQKEWDGGYSHLRLSGLLRGVTYRDLLKETNHTVAAWALQLSTKVKVLRQAELFGQLNYGKGHASYLNDLSIGSFDLIAAPGEEGRLYAPAAMGFTLGARYDLTRSVFLSATYGHLRFYPRRGVASDTYSYGQYVAADIFWNIVPRIQVGAEMLYGRRTDFSGRSASANRADVLFQLSF